MFMHNCVKLEYILCDRFLKDWLKSLDNFIYQLPLTSTSFIAAGCLMNMSISLHGLYQVMMTLHFLNNVANDAQSAQKSKLTP